MLHDVVVREHVKARLKDHKLNEDVEKEASDELMEQAKFLNDYYKHHSSSSSGKDKKEAEGPQQSGNLTPPTTPNQQQRQQKPAVMPATAILP